MTTIFAWPATLPQALGELYGLVADGTGTLDVLGSLDEIVERRGDPSPAVVVFCPDAAVASGSNPLGETVEAARVLTGLQGLTIVAVVGDGYLGSDVADPSPAMGGAAVVALARSIAATRDAGTRANVVCIPSGLFGEQGSQRGPLNTEVDVRDVSAAVRFLIDPENAYLNGQVLFVDSGRHLFSSLTA